MPIAFSPLLVGFIVVTVLMVVVWIIHFLMKNAGVVDVFWGLGIVILTAIYFVHGIGYSRRKWMILSMVAIWGLRLSSHILRRLLHEQQEDSRYQRLRADWKTHVPFKFFLFFELQAVFQVILSLPFFFVCTNPHPQIQWMEWMGLTVWLVGVIGETMADEQLKAFRTHPQNKGKVCNIGLWHYSRHPNYFFEWLIWVGFAIFALGSC